MNSEFIRLPDTSNGYRLWKRKEPHGGYSYWTDDCGIERRVLDEGLDCPFILFDVLQRNGWLDKMLQKRLNNE